MDDPLVPKDCTDQTAADAHRQEKAQDDGRFSGDGKLRIGHHASPPPSVMVRSRTMSSSMIS